MLLPSLPSSLHPLDSIAGILDLSMLYHLWISGTFLLLTWYLTTLLFRVFVTEVRSSDVLVLRVEIHTCCHRSMADRFRPLAVQGLKNSGLHIKAIVGFFSTLAGEKTQF